ncbi:hypothetical protein AVEN_200000-1 [Araneus ventricosus]|uniref:Uncharacterized protein n=1 Tax=Araneus ventricosus TaxID=182803 RepID=A0A4Y2BY22_ARAVE|nr:hypothetical protein AVEN_200000-1 [Araneus ventricosus]
MWACPSPLKSWVLTQSCIMDEIHLPTELIVPALALHGPFEKSKFLWPEKELLDSTLPSVPLRVTFEVLQEKFYAKFIPFVNQVIKTLKLLQSSLKHLTLYQLACDARTDSRMYNWVNVPFGLLFSSRSLWGAASMNSNC